MGRKAKEVDWEKVDRFLIGGMNGTEIAACFDMHHDSFYKKVEQKYNLSFTAYQQSKRSQGDGLLKYKSFEKAMKGDNTQLTLNLKNRCGWTEKAVTLSVSQGDPHTNSLIDAIQGTSKDLVNDDSEPLS